MRGLVEFARDQLGLRLYEGQVRVLEDWMASHKRKALFCLGRRSGKGIMAAVAAIHNAVIPDYSEYLLPGEQRYILIVATKEARAARMILRIKELLAKAPDKGLRKLVDEGRSNSYTIVFRTGVTIEAMPCSSKSTRGDAATMVIFDEAAHFYTDTDGPAAFRQVWRALTPSVAQFKDLGYVMVTSTPLWPSGWFYELFNAGRTASDPDLFVVQKPTWEVNENITQEDLAGEFAADPEGTRVEYGAEFLQGLGAFFDAERVAACVARGCKWRNPEIGNRYVAAIDPAFARGGDSFTLAIVHKEVHEELIVHDAIQSWRAEQAPLTGHSDRILDEVAETLKRYQVYEVTSDQFSVVPITDGLRRRGIHLHYQPLTAELKADIFTTMKRAVNMAQIELLDDPQTIAEINRLEVRPSPSGKPRIMGGGGFHDDRVMALATAVHALQRGMSGTVGLQAILAAYEGAAAY